MPQAAKKGCVYMELVLEGIKKSYNKGKTYAVKDFNVSFTPGVYGLLGPNGAGKTTLMKIITNLWKPSSGGVELFGETLMPSSYEVLKRMGSIIEFPIFFEHMSGRENLKLHCEYMGYYKPCF